MYKDLRIIFTGNPANGGISAAFKKVFPDTFFISRSNGFDLATNTGIDKFKDIIKNFNIFINHSQISINFTEEKLIGAQEKLLRITHNVWNNGHVINIGSILEFTDWKFSDPVVAEEKRQLREVSLKLNSENFKTTHLIVSGFNRYSSFENDEIKLDPNDIVYTIKHILESNIDFPLLFIEQTNDARIKKWKDIKNKFNNQ